MTLSDPTPGRPDRVEGLELEKRPCASLVCQIITFICTCVYAKSLQSCLILCDPMDSSRPGSSVHGILQARILEWVGMPSSRGSFWLRSQTWVFCIAGKFFTIWATREGPGAQYYYINRCLKGSNMKPHSKAGPGNSRHLMGNGPEVTYSSKITV